MTTTNDYIDNTAWLRGYDRYLAGESCPWTVNGDQSARLGWLAARDDAARDDAAVEVAK